MTPPPRRSRQSMTAESRARLISAARAAFARDGYGEASMDQLCAEAGLTRGALYHHFGGKEGLLEAVVRQIDQEIDQHLDQEWSRHDDPWVAFRATCLAYLDLALDAEVQRILLRDAPAVLGERLRQMDQEGSIAAITEALAALMASGRLVATDGEALARLLNGAMVDAALWIAASSDPAAALARARAALGAVLDGLERAPR